MQTQRDHVHAYQFLMGRMSSALVLGDAASAEVPARRAAVGVYIGIVLAVLIAIGFGIYGLLVPGGNTSWQAKGAIVVEKETGTRYVNLNGVLHPALNLASAKLLQGPGSKVTLLSRESIADAPRGEPVGLPDAPQVLPEPQDLVGASWLVCLPGSDTGATPAEDQLGLNFDPGVPNAMLPPDRYLLVASPDGAQYVLWGGFKFRVGAPTVPVALGMAAVRPVPAPQMWLDALPNGPVLAPAEIDGTGTPGRSIGGTTYQVGQLFEQKAANGEVQRFVLRRDGLAPVNGTEFMLRVAATSHDPVRIEAAVLASAPRSTDQSLTKRLPELADARWLDSSAGSICLRQTAVGAQVHSEVVVAGAGASAPGVHLRPGTGVLVGAVPVPPGRKVPDRYLITDGKKYLLPDDDSMKALGYVGVAVRPMPSDQLATLPSGPPLSQAALGVTKKG
ncbi:type VII secretion protein EccB [Saccharopolyspora shandongensis]|uniref:type VII secretion protein EccB n=1 Tax=Saccharopolyspora shandongensis TaxID=418495 RepID=UPI0033C5E988